MPAPKIPLPEHRRSQSEINRDLESLTERMSKALETGEPISAKIPRVVGAKLMATVGGVIPLPALCPGHSEREFKSLFNGFSKALAVGGPIGTKIPRVLGVTLKTVKTGGKA